MAKSLYSREYKIFLQHLRASRIHAGLTQKQLAARLGQAQSFVSKCERGERRLDLVELRHFCRALRIRTSDFVSKLMKAMGELP